MAQVIGTYLKKARLEKGLSLERASEDLRIQKKFLEALEDQKFQIFSSPVHVTGFLKNYSEYLGLEASQMLAFYRRDYGDVRQTLANVKPVGVRLPFFTPDKLAGVVIVSIFVTFFSYLLFQYSLFLKLPSLTVETPSGDTRVTSLQMLVSGRVSPDVQLKINGQEVNLGKDGKFSESIVLKNGTNVLTFIAANKAGRETRVVRNIVAEP